MIVLELMPTALAGGISRSLSIPTIGIGAGVETDGQILVLQDMLGLYDDFSPKFLKRFGNLKKEVENSVKSYITEVTEKIYPDADHSYS